MDTGAEPQQGRRGAPGDGDLDAVLVKLGHRGVKPFKGPFVVDEVNRRLAFIKDNCGNLIEFSEEL